MKKLQEEKERLKSERQALEQQKAIMEEKNQLEEERQKLEKEKTELAMVAPSKGRVMRGWIGVTIQDVTPELAQSFGLKEKQGALVSSVSKGDQADKAGIKSGDIIVEFDGKEIKEVNDLPKTVAATAPNKTVKIKIVKDGKEKTLSITVGTMKEEGEVLAKEEKEEAAPEKKVRLTVQAITPEMAKAGVKSGDIIKEVNGLEITSIEDYKDAIKKVGKDKTVRFLIQRGDITFYVIITQ